MHDGSTLHVGLMSHLIPVVNALHIEFWKHPKVPVSRMHVSMQSSAFVKLSFF